MRVVLDTSVIVAASRSRAGASFELLRRLDDRLYEPVLSVALYAEWCDALARPENRPPGISAEEAVGFLRYLAGRSIVQPIYFLWRPCLRDPDDDMVLELAVAARCRYIVTHNLSDFAGSDRFGIEAITPAAFLAIVREST
jgi:putative PIN family toxin of toxin-antitoxin system